MKKVSHFICRIFLYHIKVVQIQNFKDSKKTQIANIGDSDSSLRKKGESHALWSKALTADVDQKIVNHIQRWLNEQKEKRDLNEAFDTATVANSVNHLLKGDKTRSKFFIEQLNIPKAKFISLI